MRLIQLVCGLFGVLYVISWGVLLVGFLGMLLGPRLPYTGVAMTCAVYYLASCWLIRGLLRLCGYGRPAVPEVLDPESPVRIRRVILEEVSPYDQARRIVHEDVTPYDERTDHAR